MLMNFIIPTVHQILLGCSNYSIWHAAWIDEKCIQILAGKSEVKIWGDWVYMG
jgi:hypothetical protein